MNADGREILSTAPINSMWWTRDGYKARLVERTQVTKACVFLCTDEGKHYRELWLVNDYGKFCNQAYDQSDPRDIIWPIP